MSNCKACEENCGPDHVVCFTCQGTFHFECVSVREVVYRKWDKAKKEAWKCSNCCHNLVSASEISNTQNCTTGQLSLLSKQIKDLCDCVTALTISMNEQKQKNEEALTTITKQNEKLIVQERRINQLEAENGKLKENFKELSSNFNRLDQYGRRRHLEIHGIQERHNEDLRSIVTNIGKTLQLPVNDIDVVHRLKTKVKKRSPIIMTFVSRTSRDAWITKRKTGLVSNNIVGGSDDQPIFINVNLTKFNKDLFWKCRQFKKLKGFKY